MADVVEEENDTYMLFKWQKWGGRGGGTHDNNEDRGIMMQV